MHRWSKEQDRNKRKRVITDVLSRSYSHFNITAAVKTFTLPILKVLDFTGFGLVNHVQSGFFF